MLIRDYTCLNQIIESELQKNKEEVKIKTENIRSLYSVYGVKIGELRRYIVNHQLLEEKIDKIEDIYNEVPRIMLRVEEIKSPPDTPRFEESSRVEP